MKRNLLLFSLLISTVFTHAQVDYLFEYDWYLIGLEIDGEHIGAPSNSEVGIIDTLFLDASDPDFFETTVCNVLAADINADDDQITFSNIVVSLDECTIAANTEFEFEYFPFFANHDGAVFDYYISIIDGPETGEDLALSIMNPDGDYAHYFNINLNVADIELSQISVYPNPTQETLSWVVNSSGTLNVRIYSAQGKLVKTVQNSLNSIDVSALSSGLYFIELQNNQAISRAKFLKR